MNIKEYMRDNLLFLDGGMGTLLQKAGLAPGELPEEWNIQKPDLIAKIHQDYFDAGSNVVNTNTFGANILKFDEDKLEVGIGTNFCCRGCMEPSEKELIQDIANFFGLCDEEWERLGEYARKTVIENYSVKRMADDAESVYAKVIK
jgi:5-methyltetrahydrofolate--homocysteine methyltransferase